MSFLKKNLSNLESIKFSGFTDNSNFVEPSYVFLSFSKNPIDALEHARNALNKGAALVISSVDLSQELKDRNFFDPDLESNKDEYLEALFASSKKNIKIIGITGTNGKSSTAYYLHQLLSMKDSNSTLLTNMKEVLNFKNTELTPLTTPDSFLLHFLLKKSIGLKRKYFIMEVSSHGIDQGRINGLNFAGKSFTNFSQDHLDYHKTLKNYRKTKKSFFLKSDKNNVVSIDDELGKEIAFENKSTLTTSVEKNKADLFLENDLIKTPWKDLTNYLPFKSKFMTSNFLCALGLYGNLFDDVDFDSENLKKIQNLPGRLEKVSIFENKHCYVDYAHTPHAMKSVLNYLKSNYKGKIITIFGCGGERDFFKRKYMGKIAEEISDFQIITNDNPRNEDPKKIFSQITSGMKSTDYKIIFDRKEAIFEGLKKLKTLERDSVLLIAGKGHENTQIIKNKKIKFNDLDILNKFKNAI